MKESVFIEEGNFQLTDCDEGGIWKLVFDPPVEVNYTAYFEGEETIAYAQFDFGMDYSFRVDKGGNNLLICGYNGLNDQSSISEIVKSTVLFDVLHAFTHCEFDPNYQPFHWAITGWLQDRAEVIEKE